MNAPVKSRLVIPRIGGLLAKAIIMAGLSFSASTLPAQNTITNVISAVVSYQFYDAFSSLDTNSQITSPVASYQLYDAFTDLSTNSLITSPLASYQFYDQFSKLGTNSVFMSPVASEQYFDWPNSVTVAQLNSSSAGYYYVPAAPYLQLAEADQNAFQITVFEGALLSLYSVEFSPDLVNWQAMTNITITPPNVGVQIYAAASTNRAGFYRVMAQ